jgi:hypothetical protein
MKTIRHASWKRTGSILLLIIFLQSIFLPNYSFALTTGPHQPEYISYEGPGSPDMVNLSTGDFTFSLPILDVPGPEGSFSLPLSYHAGIGLDQEASWVGLGWTLNPGAITRSINEYPDDANGESQSINVKDLNVIRGWTSSILGFGQIGWNNQTGHNGSISLLGLINYNYSDSGPNSLGIAGVNISSEGVKVDPVGVAMAAMTIASMGAGGALSSGAAFLKDAAIGALTGAVMSSVFSSQTPGVGTNGFWSYSKKVKQRLFHKNYWIWLDKTRTEQMFGVLNLGYSTTQPYSPSNSDLANLGLKINGSTTSLKAFSKSQNTSSSTAFQAGVASDMSYFIGEGNYQDESNPSSIATDDFSVSGPGISGSIKPYRLEIGSLSMPREMSNSHERLALLPYLNSYKVPFMYDGSNGNSYFYHAGSNPASAPVTPLFNAGISNILGNSTPTSNTSLTFDLNDYIFTNRVKASISSTYKIPQQNHVEWFSNTEVKDGSSFTKGFIDFTPDNVTRSSFRDAYGFGVMNNTLFSNDISSGILEMPASMLSYIASGTDNVTLIISHLDENGSIPQQSQSYTVPVINKTTTTITVGISSIPLIDQSEANPNSLMIDVVLNKSIKSANSIGGYSITNGNGMTYHYALPVYDHEVITEIEDKVTTSKSTTIKRQAPFANTWLLTAITGSDYYDANSNGFPDESDWGYWVRFNYGKHNPSTLFYWRSPYSGKRIDADNKTQAHSEGKKELYYLNSIQTRTHTAIFFKEQREDGHGYSNQGTQLSVKEIYLINNADFKNLTSSTGYNLASCVGNTSKVWMLQEITNNSAALNFLNTRCLKRIKFGYSYALCKGASGYSWAVGNGKLTLDRISIMGRNSQKIMPDYVFGYASNPDYNKDYWDAWGFYNGMNSRYPQSSSVATAWSLTKVITPLGHEVQINYERDEYATVWGNPVRQNEPFIDSNWTDGISISNASSFDVGDQVSIDGSKMWECVGGTPPGEFETQFTYATTITEVGAGYIKVAQSTPQTPTCSGTINYFDITGTVSKEIIKNGGDLRVASITTKEEGGQTYKVRYIYGNGAISQEPSYLRSINYTTFPFNLPDFPNTPVIYGRVEVLNGKLTSDADYDSKQVYEFEIPKAEHIIYTKTPLSVKQLIYDKTVTPSTILDINFKEYLTKTTHEIANYTSRIGRLNKTQVFNSSNQIKSTSQFYYKNDLPSQQGLYTEGSIMTDRIFLFKDVTLENRFPAQDKTHARYEAFDLISRTYKKDYPNVLYKVVNSKDGFSDYSEDIAWDFISGAVTEKISESALGVKVKSVFKPAYQFYPELGPKASSANPVTNKNMVNVMAAQYDYKLDNANAITGLISGSASTWKKDWNNYRYESGTSYTQGTQGPDVWRKHKEFFYKGTYASLKTDGSLTFTPANEFSFVNGAANTGWQLAGEVNRYDHFSLPVETKDLYGRYSSVKTDLDGKQVLAQAENATYFEFAFSGAEDGDNTKPFFGGEIERKDGTVTTKVVATDVHTGNAAVQVGVNGKTFTYKPASLTSNRIYRVSVWTNSLNGAIYYLLNGPTEQTILPTSTKRVGNWYQINAEIPVAAFSSLEVGVKSTSGTIKFDDFRFQPIDASVSANVYHPITGELEYSLDNNNVYTRYEYNDRGLLIKTHREFLKYNSEKLLTETRDNYKRFNTNQ